MSLVYRTKALAERLGRSKALTEARAPQQPVIATAATPVTRTPRTVTAATAAIAPAAPVVPRAAIDRAVRLAQPTAVLPTEEIPGSNNRRAKRKQTALPAMITFQNMRVSVPCTIADMSGTGAKLSFTQATINQFGELEHLPQKFILILKADRMQVESEVKWRRDGKIGVRFLGPPKPVEARR